MRTSIRAMALLLATVGLAAPAHAQSVPTLMNYQGQILNPDGTAPPTADYELSFGIYDAAEGGNLVWGPQLFDGRSGPGLGTRVPVVQGYFNVALGPIDMASRSLATAFNGATRYLEITVSNRPPIAPRQQILSAPFALKAALADEAIHAQTAGQAAQAGLAQTAVWATNALNADNVGAMPASNLFLGLVPVGAILPYFGDLTALPASWRLCDGSVVSDTASPFDGQYLPDLREMFLRGTSSAWLLSWTGGQDYIGSHSHWFSDSDTSVWFERRSGNGRYAAYHPATQAGSFDYSVRNIGSPADVSNPYETHGHMNGQSYISGYTDSAGSHDNRPRFVSVHYIIRIK